MDEDIRTATWKLGRAFLGERKVSLIGKWAKETRNDFWAIFNALCGAIKAKTEDPVPYIQAALNDSVEAKNVPKVTFLFVPLIMPMFTFEAERKWLATCEKVVAKVGQDIWISWFSQMRLEGLHPVTVSLPSDYMRDKFASNYLSYLRDALDGAEVELTVRQEAA